MEGRTIVVESIYNADTKTLWRALTKKEEMKHWYFDLAEFKATIGFTFEFMGGPEDGAQYKHVCEITEVVTEAKLSYRWKYQGYEGKSFVTFELFPENPGTRLKLTHQGIDTFPATNPDFAIHNFEQGWNHILKTALKDYLDNK
ncbi:MAG: SRPBCC domain-containing protein [Salinivirgaceae bacterium]|jgi:uncharacterized protein YndB with AHSA1/START domain